MYEHVRVCVYVCPSEREVGGLGREGKGKSRQTDQIKQPFVTIQYAFVAFKLNV